MREKLDLSMLGHVLLDSASHDRVDIEGNLFRNTFGVLNDYLKTRNDLSPKIQALAQDIESLVTREYEIGELSESSNSAWIKNKKTVDSIESFDAFIHKTQVEINALTPGQKMLLPGGWRGINQPGHAMIYQFERADNGDLLFSIFNSGAGLHKHEQTSGLESELYSPEKIYRIPNDANPVEINQLLARLITPQLTGVHPKRAMREFSAKELYDDLDISFGFLEAAPLDKPLTNTKDTTAGQLSGTCAMRSIHQMLKINFPSLAEYQRFIFDFKMHVLRNYLHNNLASVNHPEVLAFLDEAITHNLRILQVPGVLDDVAQQDAVIDELKQFKQSLIEQQNTLQMNFILQHYAALESIQPWLIPVMLLAQGINFISSLSKIISTKTPNKTIDRFESKQTIPETLPKPVVHRIGESHLLDELHTIIERCKQRLDDNPLWVITQIDELLLRLPIPAVSKPEDPCYDIIPFYQSLNNSNDIESMLITLDELSELHRVASQKHLPNAMIPKQVITCLSLLTLQDYFEVTGSHKPPRPSFHKAYATRLAAALKYPAYTYFASAHPDYDKRFLNLLNLCGTPNQSSSDFAYFYIYGASLLNSEPSLKQDLQLLEQQFLRGYKQTGYSFSQSGSYYRNNELGSDDGKLMRFIYNQFDNHFQLKNGSPLRHKKFESIVKKFQHLVHLDKICNSYLMLISNRQSGASAKIYYENWFGTRLSIGHTEGGYQPFDSGGSQVISKHLYNLEQSVARTALDQSLRSFELRPLPTKSSNEIQLENLDRNKSHSNSSITKEDYRNRILFHLRLSSAHQLTLTLDYFSRPDVIQQLKDRNLALYLKANVFEPGLLITALENDPTFIYRFDDFISQGLRLFSRANGLIEQSALFFLSLHNQVHRYAAFLNSNPDIIPALRHAQTRIQEQIEKHDDPSILSTLHREYFLNAVALLNLQAADQTTLLHAVQSYLYSQSIQNNYIRDDTVTRDELQRQALYLNEWMQTVQEDELKPVLNSFMHTLHIDISRLTYAGEYPRIHYKNSSGNIEYTINLEQGKIYHHGRTLSKLPLSVKNTPLIRKLGFDEHTLCWLSEDQTMGEFIGSPIRIRHKNNQFIVQKQWACNGMPNKWYQLQAVSKAQANYYGIEQTNASILPSILQDSSVELWVSATDSLVMLAGKPLYQIDKTGIFHQLDEQGQRTGYVLSKLPAAYASALSQFENSSYILANLNTNAEGTIDFPRYGLSLSLKGNKISLPNSDYYLQSEPDPRFIHDVAYLHFSNGHDDSYITARQAFSSNTYNSSPVGAEKAIRHDNSASIKDGRLEIEIGHQDDNKMVYYYNTEHYVVYHSVQGFIKPNNGADALYLCYLYLAKHDTQKAFEILDKIERGLITLEGSQQELTYLFWIMHGLPIVYDLLGNIVTKLDNKTPEYIACQLKAMATITDFLALNEFSSLGDTPLKLIQPHGIEDKRWLKYIALFSKNLQKEIIALITLYQTRKRHLSDAFILDDETLRNLIHYCEEHNQDANVVNQGSIGYLRMQLSLKQLMQEYQQLLAMQFSLTPVPEHLKQHLLDIEQTLSHEVQIMKRSTKLDWKPIEHPIPNDAVRRLTSSSQNSFSEQLWSERVGKTSNNPSEAMQALTSGITLATLRKHFATYLKLGWSGNPDEKKIIQQFCRRILQTFPSDYSQLKPAKTDSATNPNEVYITERINFYYLVYSLYNAIENPNVFNTNDLYQITENTPFGDILTDTSKCLIPPINKAYVKNVFEDMLSSNTIIWQELQQTALQKKPLPALSPMYPESLYQTLCMAETMQAYRELTTTYENRLTLLLQESDPNTLSQHDDEAGHLEYNCVQEQRRLAEALFQDGAVRNDLVLKLHALKIDDDALEESWDAVIELANSGPLDPQLLRKKSIRLLAKQQHELTQAELITLYLKADLTSYLEKTGLPETTCRELHEQIHQIVSTQVRQNHIRSLLNALRLANEQNPPEPSQLHQIVSILMTENCLEAQSDPTLMVMQYSDQLLLRPRQVKVLKTLLPTELEPTHTKNIVEQVIMGGGKSKVILPLLAKKKANGLNFVIVEVPNAMLATNHADLAETSSRLFGQKAKRFEFNRNSDCSPQHLKSIYEKFVSIMVNQDYLVTTGESMQSLQLKYLELLDSRPLTTEQQAIWEQQIFWASKIVTLMKERGDAVIDEVHQGLLLKKKLNYSIGSQETVSSELIKHSIDLYRFADALNLSCPRLEDLMEHPNSPLQELIQALQLAYPEQEVTTAIRSYLNNESMPDLILACDTITRDTLAFYKKQLQLLPQTRARHYKEEYGPSEKPATSLKRAPAIPYLASNQPNERSRFGNSWETINYTIQGVLIDGFNEELLLDLIHYWQEVAENQFLEHPEKYATRGDTPMAEHVAELLQDLNVNLSDLYSSAYTTKPSKKLAALVQHVQYRKDMLYELLREKILPQLRFEPSILHSNACNHVDLYHSVQGLTATPYNSSTFHLSMEFDLKQSLGTDGYTKAVLHDKSPSIRQFPKPANAKQLIEYLIAQPGENRAIIDIGAQFAGYPNLEIARLIAHQVVQTQQTIKWVLYFNSDNVICALNTKTLESIELRVSNAQEIDKRLDCKPHERWTYYDQGHTEAADLKQMHNANALVLVDGRTYIKSFLQGCMRMRDLDKGQTVSIFVPPGVPNNYSDLVDLMQKNQTTKLQEDNFYAAIDNINNLIREDFLRRLASLPPSQAQEKYMLYQQFRNYFVDTKSNSLFEQFGGIYQAQASSLLFEQHKMQVMQYWENILIKANINVLPEEVNTMSSKIDTITQSSLPLCPDKMVSFTQRRQELGTEVEKELLKETEQEQEQEQEKELYDSKLVKQKPHKWVIDQKSESAPWNEFVAQGSNQFIRTLNDATQSTRYSPELFVDENYATVFEGQTRTIGPYLKPVFAILFRQQGESISACIIDVADLNELKDLVQDTQSSQDAKVWISTTQHHLLEGTFPDNILQNKQYLSLIEQIRFFNGEFDLLRQEKTYHWLSEDNLGSFGSELLRYRPINNDSYETFVNSFTEKKRINASAATSSGKLGIFAHPEASLSRLHQEKPAIAQLVVDNTSSKPK